MPPPRTVVAPRPAPAPDVEPVTTAVAAAPARRSSPEDIRGTTARRSSTDDITARATTTLIPNSPGDRAKAGPVFVDGSGRRARRFKGLAVAAATLAAGYVGVVVTGALAGSTGPAAGPAPVANGASLAPAPAVPAPVVPSPITATPADVTTKAAPKRTTTAKKVAPRTTTPRRVAPAPVVPAPAAPVAPAAPAAPAVPQEQPVEKTTPKQQQPQGNTAEQNPAVQNL